MSTQPNPVPGSGTAFGSTKTMDMGLRGHMIRVFNTVAIGLAITAITSLAVYLVPPLRAIFMNPIVSTVTTIGLLLFLWFGMNPSKMLQQSVGSAWTKYTIFTAVLGTTCAYWYAVYTGRSLAQVFFITSAMFAGTSLFGYTTKRDLTSLGTFFVMGLIGLIVAMIVNMFLKSSAFGFVISGIGVILFTGLIAFEAQNAKRLYNPAQSDETNQKLAIYSALGLYINFINLFQFLLSILGNRN